MEKKILSSYSLLLPTPGPHDNFDYTNIVAKHWDLPLTPSECFKIRDCPNCKQLTAQDQVSYDPDDPESFLVWHCTMCKENIDLV